MVSVLVLELDRTSAFSLRLTSKVNGYDMIDTQETSERLIHDTRQKQAALHFMEDLCLLKRKNYS